MTTDLGTPAVLSPDEEANNRAVMDSQYINRMSGQLRTGAQKVRDGVLTDPPVADDEPDVETVLSSTLIGTEEQVARKIATFEAMGITHISLTFRFGRVGDDEVRTSMETFMRLLRHT